MVTLQNSILPKFCELIQELLQLPANYVRPSNQNMPAGGVKAEFITVNIGQITGGLGHQQRDEVTYAPDLRYTVDGLRKAVATVQAFGDSSFELLVQLNALLDSEWATWLFQQSNFGLASRRGPNDLTTLVPAKMWQIRALMEVDFYFIAHGEVRVPTFSSFGWTIYMDEDGSAHYEVKVT